MIAATIALAPFENLSDDPGQDYFARGFVEDVATELSRFGTLEVLHPRSVAAFLRARGGDADNGPRADHMLHGSVRQTGEVVRVGVQLVEAANGRQLWADRYDATASDLLAVQAEIAARIAGALAIRVDEARLDAARRTPLASLEIYDCWLRGLDCIHKGTVEADAEARTFFERALEIDPDYARAYTGLSLSHFNEWSCQAWEHWDEKERRAYDYAVRAAALDDSDGMVQVVLGRILVYRRQFDEAAHHLDRALALNPNDTDVLVHAALCRAYLGDGESALSLANKAMRLNPFFPAWYAAPAGLALFVLGRDAECIELCGRIPTSMFVDVAAFAAATCALGGETARAAGYLKRFLTDFSERITFGRVPDPGEPLRWLLHVNPFRRGEDGARLARGLRAAGLESDPDEGRSEAVVHSAGPEVPSATFRREGPFWTLAFEGLAVQLTNQKGFQDLARLLARPGEETHCLELADRPADAGGRAPVLDERARREIQARVRELQHQIDSADALHDTARAERAREELDQIVELLSGALGLRGRSRQLGSVAERARSAVTWRIRSAIKKIAAAHPRLGRHLENAVRTGTFCAYRPEAPLNWAL
jgi:TolB-like protein/tetratricopeptide (TPR) repeat protein